MPTERKPPAGAGPSARPSRIVSGGQSGVDRAALDVALELGLPCGGWCPAGRAAQDGPLPARYPLRETPSADPAQRTEWNVRDSAGTLLLLRGAPAGGTALTLSLAERLARPCFALQVAVAQPAAVRAWLAGHAIATLNVAGPRESEAPGIYGQARAFLLRLLG
jgi:Circularly permutated YpsA SLOG family